MEFYENLFYSDTAVNDIGLYCCGKRIQAQNHKFGPAARDYYWFIYMQSGSGYYTMEDSTFRLKKNTMFVAYPNRRIHYHADEGSEWSIRWVSLGSPMIGNYLNKMNVSPDNPLINVSTPTAVENTLETLFNTIPIHTVQSEFLSVSLVYNLLALLTEATLTANKGHDYITDAIFFMSHNYDRELTVKDVADSVNLERVYFSKLFHSKTGVTPIKWLTNHRMEKAASLLLHSGLKISEIARSVGYDDQLYFSRVFSMKFGKPPKAYRTEHTEKL